MADLTICGGGTDEGLLTKALARFGPTDDFQLVEIRRRYPLGPHDILIEIAYCGICFSDVDIARDGWKNAIYPMVPGHEITGFVKEIGPDVTKFKVGDKCGAGIFMHTCGSCSRCSNKADNYCQSAVLAFNSKDDTNGGGVTYGGFSTHIVVVDYWVYKWPDKLPMDTGAPLLCAGITVYWPLRHLKIGPGSRVGIVGLGGLGHVAVRLAHAMGAFVCVFSRGGSEKKERLAKELGADMFVATKDGRLDCGGGPLDAIIDTVSADHDINGLISLLDFEGTYVVVGEPPNQTMVSLRNLTIRRRTLMGSCNGSSEETQDLLDFCAEKGIGCMIETIGIQDVNEAFKRILMGDVYFRFVIDIKGSKW